MDILGIHFLPMDKSKIQLYLRCGGTQVKLAAKYGPNGLCVFTSISEETGILICLWKKNEPLVGPQQPQIGGIESYFLG